MGVIDYRNSKAIYEQIAEHYEKLILRGVMEEDEQMPSVRSLAVELSTNPNTVQKAYSKLENDGFIYTVKGKGNFVKNANELLEKKKNKIRKDLSEVLKEAEELGFDTEELIKEVRERD